MRCKECANLTDQKVISTDIVGVLQNDKSILWEADVKITFVPICKIDRQERIGNENCSTGQFKSRLSDPT